MINVRPEGANIKLVGDGGPIGDIFARRGHGVIATQWRLTHAERAAIADGKDVAVLTLGGVFPPMVVQVLMDVCPVCCQPVEPGTGAPPNSHGQILHPFCLTLATDDLADDFERMFRANPDRWEELPDGKWRDKLPLEEVAAPTEPQDERRFLRLMPGQLITTACVEFDGDAIPEAVGIDSECIGEPYDPKRKHHDRLFMVPIAVY